MGFRANGGLFLYLKGSSGTWFLMFCFTSVAMILSFLIYCDCNLLSGCVVLYQPSVTESLFMLGFCPFSSWAIAYRKYSCAFAWVIYTLSFSGLCSQIWRQEVKGLRSIREIGFSIFDFSMNFRTFFQLCQKCPSTGEE